MKKMALSTSYTCTILSFTSQVAMYGIDGQAQTGQGHHCWTSHVLHAVVHI